jgi:hypothetical protein
MDLRVASEASLSSAVGRLGAAGDVGIGGSGTWVANAAAGTIASRDVRPGSASRIILNVKGEQSLAFDMSVADGSWDDTLVFYVDGKQQAVTYGDAVVVKPVLRGRGSHVLMWEFTKGSGTAVIREVNF